MCVSLWGCFGQNVFFCIGIDICDIVHDVEINVFRLC